MKVIIAAMACVLLFAGCESNPRKKDAAVRGAIIGAVGGAAVTAIAGGDPVAGAAIGAAGGAVIGSVMEDGKQRRLHRDAYGRQYWVDDRGRWRYVEGRR